MNAKTRILLMALALVLVTVVVVEAGPDRDRQDREPKTWRYDRMPSMKFLRGTLQRDLLTGWEIGQVTVQLAPDCRVVGNEGRPADLQEGRQVLVMGPRAGNTIVAWRIQVIKEAYTAGMAHPGESIEWSDADSTVGEAASHE